MNGRLPQAAKEGPQCARIPGNVTASATLSDQVMELADVSWFGAGLVLTCFQAPRRKSDFLMC